MLSEHLVKINVVEVVGDSICVTDGDGKKLYDVIFGALSNEKEIIISFDGVTDLTSAFLNNAIGRLYGKFEKDYIRSKLRVSDMSKNDMVLLKRVVDRAKSFFEDQTLHGNKQLLSPNNLEIGNIPKCNP